MIATIRHALRSLRRSPAFTLTVVATLGLGIGLNAAIFAVVDNVLLRPLGYRDADRIVALMTRFEKSGNLIGSVGGDDYVDLSQRLKGLEATAYYQYFSDGISLNGNALYLPVAIVSPKFMQVMGVQPIAGRLFNPSDERGTDAVVGEEFAREHFGSAQAAVGRTLRFGEPYTIVGVVPAGFSFPARVQVWAEEAAVPAIRSRTAYNQRAVAKRRADVSPEQLAAEMASFSAQMAQANVEDQHKTMETVPLQEQIVGRVKPTLNLLMASVAVVLLIVCANITHLQLVRATEQLRAVSIRAALGASRARLAARGLIEAALLAAAGCAAAVAIAVPALKLLVRLAPPDLPRLAEVHLNADVFAFSLLLSFVVMAVTALLPVWRSWQVDPASALRQDAARGGEGRATLRLRDGLVVAEVALTLTLSVAAILLARQLMDHAKTELGFAAESLVTLDTHDVGATSMPDSPKEHTAAAMAAYESAAEPIKRERVARLERTLDAVRAPPGVVSVGAMDGAPMMNGAGGSNVSYAIKGRSTFEAGVENLPIAELRPVTPGLLATMGVPLLKGRALGAEDRLGAPPVLLIDETLASTIFKGEDPIGKQIMCGYDDVSDWWTIVGVVGAIHDDAPGALPRPTFYIPVAQHAGPAEDMQIVVRTALDPGQMAEQLRRSLAASHPEIAVRATTMRENIGETERPGRFREVLLGSFAGVSLLLAAVGMYGVTAYSVAQRRFEFGLRVALGADRPQLFVLVLRKALVFAAAGVVIGIGLSLGLERVLASVVGKLPTNDPVAYGLASLAVLGIAVLAMFVPARAAARVEPMSVLRSE